MLLRPLSFEIVVKIQKINRPLLSKAPKICAISNVSSEVAVVVGKLNVEVEVTAEYTWWCSQESKYELSGGKISPYLQSWHYSPYWTRLLKGVEGNELVLHRHSKERLRIGREHCLSTSATQAFTYTTRTKTVCAYTVHIYTINSICTYSAYTLYLHNSVKDISTEELGFLLKYLRCRMKQITPITEPKSTAITTGTHTNIHTFRPLFSSSSSWSVSLTEIKCTYVLCHYYIFIFL